MSFQPTESWDQSWIEAEERGHCMCSDLRAEATIRRPGSDSDSTVYHTVTNIPLWGNEGDEWILSRVMPELREMLVSEAVLEPGEELPTVRVLHD